MKDETEMLAFIRSKLPEPLYLAFIHLWREHDQDVLAAARRERYNLPAIPTPVAQLNALKPVVLLIQHSPLEIDADSNHNHNPVPMIRSAASA